MADRRSAAPTLADVAAEAGVSQATASRALAGSPLVNANTRQRVWEVAERLRFQPNRLARSLRSGATMAVGLVVPDVGAAFYARALKSAQDVLEAAGYHVLVLNTGRAAAREREALRTLRAHQVDGLLVATSGGYEDIGVPAVFFDNVPAQPGAGAVAMDNDAGVRLLVEHLVDVHGHERIAYVGPPEAVGTGAGDVLQGAGPRAAGGVPRRGRARRAAAAAGVRAHERAGELRGGRARRGARADGARRSRRPRSSAAPTSSPPGCCAGCASAGCASRSDVALVSFDEPVSADLLDPPITSLDRHDRELGRLAAEALLRALARRRRPAGRRCACRPALSVRRSCGCDLTEACACDATLCSRLQSIARMTVRRRDGAADRDRRDRHGLDGARAQRGVPARCSSTSPTSGCAPDSLMAADVSEDRRAHAERIGFETTTDDWRAVVEDPGSRSSTSRCPTSCTARSRSRRSQAGKHLWVEKPVGRGRRGHGRRWPRPRAAPAS